MAALPEDMSVDLKLVIDELESAIVDLESRLESARAERDEAAGRQVELEIANSNLRRELNLAREGQSATAEILGSIASTPGNAAQVLQQIAETSARLFGAPSASIQIAENGEWTETYRFGDSAIRVRAAVPLDTVKIGGPNLPGTVVAENRQINIPDLDNLDPAIAHWPGPPHARAAGTRTMCGTPLRCKGEAIGVLIVYRDRAVPFTGEELALQQSFADQAAIAIENARLVKETQEALEQQRAIASILSVINHAGGNLYPVFDCILENAHRLCGAPCGSLQLYQGDRVVPVAIRGMTAAFHEFLRAGYPITDGIREGLMADHPVQIADLAEVVRSRDEPSLRVAVELGGIRTMTTVPLAKDGITFGRIVAGRREVSPFKDKQIALLQSFAAQAVIAIENARLFNETQEALARQTATSEVLQVIGSSVADTAPVFEKILDSCQNLFATEQLGLLVVRDGLTHAVAWRGTALEAIIESFPRPVAETATGLAIRSRKVINIPHAAAMVEMPPTVNAVYEQIGDFSAAWAPMIREQTGIGVICALRQPPKPFSERELSLLSTFADQAVIAIENTRLFNETREALERQTATAEVLKVIASSPSDVQPVFEAIAESANRLLGGFSTAVFRFLDGSVHLAAFTPVNPAADAALKADFPQPADAFVGFRLAQAGKPFPIPDTEEIAHAPVQQIARTTGFRSMLFVPLMRGGVPIGIIIVTRAEPGAFAPHHVQLLQTFADQAVIAIENVRLFDEVHARTNDLSESLRQQTAVGDVLKTISRSTFDLQPVLEALVQSAAQLCDAEMAFILRREGDEYRAGAAVGFNTEFIEFLKTHPLPVDRGSVTGRAVLEGHPVQILDVATDPDYTLRESTTLAHQHTALGVPLLRENEPIGAIVLSRQRVEAFTQKQIDLVTTFADQAVIAIENVRLFNEVRQRTEDLGEALQQQTATADVLKVISRSAFDLQPVLDALLSSACQLCGADIGTIRYRDAGEFRLAATFGCSPEWTEQFSRYSNRPDRSSVFGRTVVDGRTVHIPDVLADPDFKRPDAQKLMGFRAALGAPLTREGQVFGVINLFRFSVGSFDDRQVELVQTFADQAVIAIENVRLFNEVRARTDDLSEALQQQTATADVLKLISRSAFDLQAVLDTLTESAARLCNADMGAIALKDDRGYYHATNYNFPVDWVKIASVHRLQPGRESVIGRTLLARAAVQIEDVLADPEYRYPDMQQAAGYRSLLGVPMMREGEPIGVLFLGHKTVERFTEKQVELVSTFADQAVIAIENVRLFDEVQAKTRDLSEALTYQTGSANILKVIASTPTNAEPALKAIVESACELCEAYDCVLVLKDGDDLRFSAHHGPIPMTVEKWPINRRWTAGRAFVDKKPVHVHDLLAEGDEFPDGRELSQRMGHRTILSVPLLREGDSVGAIVLRRTEVQPFSEKQISLLQTFADQAVIAIGNVRLFEEVQARTLELAESLEQQTATSEVLGVISRSAGDLAPVFEAMLGNAMQLCGANFGVLNTYDGTQFHTAATYGLPPAYEEFRRNQPLEYGPGTAPARLLQGEPHVEITDLINSEAYRRGDPNRRALADLGGARSLLAVPLLKDERVVGNVMIFRQEDRPFSDKQIALLEQFAAQAVIAIENTRLLRELRQRTEDLSETLQQQTATADVLKVIASSPTDVDPVLRSIVENACELCEANDAVVLLRDGDDLRFRAHHGPIEINVEKWPIGRDWTAGRAFLDQTTVHMTDIFSDQATDFAGSRELTRHSGADVHTVLSVPLLREGEGVGVITLRRQEVKPFSDNQIALLQTFADQAVIAIGNVRLFEEVQAKTRDLEESLRQQTATADVLKVISRSAFDLQIVLDTLVESAARLCEADMAAITRKAGDVYFRAGSYGFPSEFADYVKDLPVVPDKRTITGRTLLGDKIIHVADVLEDPDYKFEGQELSGNPRTFLGVPMLREGSPVGAIVLARRSVWPFSEKQIELVTTFADQAVIAIENVRLFDEVQQRTRELATSLNDLRTAQDRLVQTEKLASLGQLTAGIAHEIKNPLNFVNNFASLSAELTGELNDLLRQTEIGAKVRAEVDDLTGLLKDNLAKVVQHGRRADSIVKNMLLHSREGGGEHRPSDINALVDESLNLAYHGARAEKPDFNVTIERDFDSAAGVLDVFPQEITRVFLNLVSNGFYAVTKRRKQAGEPGFEPTLRASTRNLGDAVEIRIRDNGTGITPEVKEKMFNPFFTTKPAGEGTGLGLSMSHDIIVKQHGGTIDVHTEQGVFTEFCIVLPRKSNFAEKSRG